MANKPVITIPIDATQFQAFYDLFKEYEAQVEAMPEEWKKQNDAVRRGAIEMQGFTSASHEALDNAADAMRETAEALRKATEAQKEFQAAAGGGEKTLSNMAKSAKSLGSEVFGIGKYLMKIGVLGAGFAGLGSILGALSLRDLAMSAVNDRQEARSMGVSTGQLRAFEQDFRGIVDPGVLERTANAQNSYSGRTALMRSAGVTYDQAATLPVDELTRRSMLRLHDWWANTAPQMRTQENFDALGFGNQYRLDDARVIGQESRKQLEGQWTAYGADSKAFDVSDKTTDSWMTFINELDRAGHTLETSLTNKLVDLSPSISGLVKTITDDAQILLNSALTPDNVKKISDGINTFTAYLSSGQAKSDIAAIGTNIGRLADDLKWAADKLSWIPIPKAADVQSAVQNPLGTIGKASWNDMTPGAGDRVRGQMFKANADHVRFEAEHKYGLPEGLIGAQQGVESSGDPFARGSMTKYGRALGVAQFLEPTYKNLGGTNPFDPYEATEKQAMYDARLYKKYHGDLRKTLAAYNWGEGNLDKDIAKNGDNWEAAMPSGVRSKVESYLAQILGAVVRNGPAQVTVHAPAGARVSQQLNAASK